MKKKVKAKRPVKNKAVLLFLPPAMMKDLSVIGYGKVAPGLKHFLFRMKGEIRKMAKKIKEAA